MSNYVDIKFIYEKLQDEQSKNIFINRLNWSISKDDYYLFAETDSKVTDLLHKINLDTPIIIYGLNHNADTLFNVFNRYINITCFCDENFDGNKYHRDLPVISFDELIAKYKDCIILMSDNIRLKSVYNLIKNGLKKEQIITFIKNSTEYFDLPCFVPNENEIFVDAGGYTGDTVIKFLTWCNYKYKKIYAIEPDENNCKTLMANIKKESFDNIHIYQQGVWNKKDILKFEDTGNVDSKIAPDGKSSIKVDTIDNIVANDKVTFIKLDVEGAELEALQGAYQTIKQHNPRIAVCIYHKPEDFIEIPLYFINNFPDYKLYIRKYSYSWNYYDVILYAI